MLSADVINVPAETFFYRMKAPDAKETHALTAELPTHRSDELLRSLAVSSSSNREKVASRPAIHEKHPENSNLTLGQVFADKVKGLLLQASGCLCRLAIVGSLTAGWAILPLNLFAAAGFFALEQKISEKIKDRGGRPCFRLIN